MHKCLDAKFQKVGLLLKVFIFYDKASYFCQVLSHSWEWISRNNNTGLMALSEEALESKQKSARSIRKLRCYQGDILKNLVQAHQTMQLESDVFLNKPYECRNRNVSNLCGHNFH